MMLPKLPLEIKKEKLTTEEGYFSISKQAEDETSPGIKIDPSILHRNGKKGDKQGYSREKSNCLL